MRKPEKEQIVEQLTERLQTSQALLVTDFRGLTMTQIDSLRGELLTHGAKFQVVKNTLTRRAAEAAGADMLLALLEGPSAIACLDAEGDPVAVAKALADAARTTRVLAVRGGILEGGPLSPEDVANLAKLPPADVLRAQLVGALAASLTTVVGLFAAPMRDLVGVLQARIDQLEAQGGGAAEEERSDENTGSTEHETERQRARAKDEQDRELTSE